MILAESLGTVIRSSRKEAVGVYLPEGYFHLRPPKTVRLGRFTCLR